MEDKVQYNKKLIIFLSIVVLAYIILNLVTYLIEKDYTTKKINENKMYVYTKYESTKKNSQIPYINLVGSDAKNVNDQIYTKAYNYLVDDDKNKEVTYNFNVSKNLVSVVMTYREMIDAKLVYSFDTYVFDMKNDCKLVSDEELLEKYRLIKQDVKNIMEGAMKVKYDEEVNKGYFIKTECNLKCYLKLRGINDITENNNYYVENSHLVIYRSYDTYSRYNEERYFTRNDFKFIIK